MRLAFILILALCVRLAGVWFGLPDLYHADEPIVVNHALAYGAGDLNPHFFKIPPLTSYALFVFYGVYFLIGRLFHRFGNVDDFATLFVSDPTSFYLIGRLLLGVMLGSLTVFYLYRLTEKFLSKERALYASFFLALCFLHVRDSHYIYTDIPVVLTLVLCFFPLFRISERGRTGDYVAFGFLAGSAVAVKYNAVLVFIPFLCLCFVKWLFDKNSLRFGQVVASLLVGLIVYSALNPFSWIDLWSFWGELTQQSRVESFVGPLHHLRYSLAKGMGLPLLALSLLGAFRALVQPERKRGILLSFLAAYYVVLAFFSQPFERYALPLIPFLCLFAGDGLVWMKERIKLPSVACLVLACLVALPSAVKVYASDALFMQKDVRTEGREWIEEFVPSGTRIALDDPFFMPRLNRSLNQLEEMNREISGGPSPNKIQAKRLEVMLREAHKTAKPSYELYFFKESQGWNNFLFSKPQIPANLGAFRDRGIKYVLVYALPKGKKRLIDQELETQAKLVAQFSPYKDERRERSIEALHMTGGPFRWEELKARERNGHSIRVYELK